VDATFGFATFGSVAAAQVVDASTRVGVHHPEGFFLLGHVVEQLDQYHVFEHVGVIAGVKSVSITEHVPRVAGFAALATQSSIFFNGQCLNKEAS